MQLNSSVTWIRFERTNCGYIDREIFVSGRVRPC